jgi:hypothetical protein
MHCEYSSALSNALPAWPPLALPPPLPLLPSLPVSADESPPHPVSSTPASSTAAAGRVRTRGRLCVRNVELRVMNMG